MGYKLAGYNVIGNCEIDPKTNAMYNLNHHPKHSFTMDIRDFAKLNEYPSELYNLDILDGSPPCTSFSMAGVREKDWGKKKVFAEGDQLQRLDDLFFPFIKLGEKLKPKVIVAENVSGLLNGYAKGYVTEILNAYKAAGYVTQIFKLNAATMGVPQARERVFFISHRQDLNFAKLKLVFNEAPITFGQYRSECGVPVKPGSVTDKLLKQRIPSDTSLSDINERLGRKGSGYTARIVADNAVCPTIISSGSCFRHSDGCKFTDSDFILSQSFPIDYKFSNKTPQFVCGMSVPPIMMAKISGEIYKQWLS